MENNNKFVWKLEEMVLLNKSEEEIQDIVRNTLEEYKIEFINNINNDKLYRILEAKKRYKEDLKNEVIKVDNTGFPKNVSLKAWIKRNGYDDIISNYVNGIWTTLGKTKNILNCERHIGRLNIKGNYDKFDNFVDELFYRQLKRCVLLEKNYFREHDEYTILEEKLMSNMKKYNTNFGLELSWGTDGVKLWYDNDNSRKLTVDEMKILIGKYEGLDDMIKNISKGIKEIIK